MPFYIVESYESVLHHTSPSSGSFLTLDGVPAEPRGCGVYLYELELSEDPAKVHHATYTERDRQSPVMERNSRWAPERDCPWWVVKITGDHTHHYCAGRPDVRSTGEPFAKRQIPLHEI